MFLMMTNGFGCILGGIVAVKLLRCTPKTALPTGRPYGDFRWLLRGSGLRVHGDVQI